jgi:hypothetical protein
MKDQATASMVEPKERVSVEVAIWKSFLNASIMRLAGAEKQTQNGSNPTVSDVKIGEFIQRVFVLH